MNAMKKRLLLTFISMLSVLGLTLPAGTGMAVTPAQTPLAGAVLAQNYQFQSALPILDAVADAQHPNATIQTLITGAAQTDIEAREFKANMLPPTFVPTGGDPAYTGTTVWGYVKAGTDTSVARDTYTGPVAIAVRGTPSLFKFSNNLTSTATTNALAYLSTIDQSLHWANPNMIDRYVNIGTPQNPIWVGNPNHYVGDIPMAVHLHGGEDAAATDGGPDSWFTSGGMHGPAFYSMDGNTNGNYCIYRYPNVQESAPLWFHDHTLGATRLNVYMGLAGGYYLIDPNWVHPVGLELLGLDREGGVTPTYTEESPENYDADTLIIPLVVQDRMFDTNGQLYFPTGMAAPDHQYWDMEFLGDTICVNGKLWPYLDVKAQRYEFLMINGSNARSYILSFKSNGQSTVNAYHPKIWQVATDQGYLDKPVGLDELIIMPGERSQFIIDFAGIPAGTNLVLNNFGADVPLNYYPIDPTDQADPTTTGRVMQFRVVSGAVSPDTSYNPSAAVPNPIRTGAQQIVRLVNPVTGKLGTGVNPSLTRALTLNDYGSVPGVSSILVNNTKWTGRQPNPANPNDMMAPADQASWLLDNVGMGNYVSETPREGTTEVWEIINLTPDSHPIHTHLAQFQVLNRQGFAGNVGLMADQLDFVSAGGYFAAYASAFSGGTVKTEVGPPLAYGPSKASGNKYGGNPDITPYLVGLAQKPLPNEAGWKDTVRCPPNTVTRFVIRWAPTDLAVTAPASALHYDFIPNDKMAGTNLYFDYVWHCHIVDHEDNEMMRPDIILPNPLVPATSRTFRMGIQY
jgi:spore coat protein A, manganese oxidase